MEAQRVVALELRLELLSEFRARVEPRDLVLVLVGHQLEPVARDGFRQCRRTLRLLLLGRTDLVDQTTVALGVRGILVVGQEGDAARDHLVERFGHGLAVDDRGLRRDEPLDGLQVDGGTTAPQERGLVHLHGGAVQLDRLVQRVGRDRHEAALHRVAEHEHVGRDRVAHQRRRDARRAHELRVLGTDGVTDRVAQRFARELEVRVASEVARHLLVRVRDDLRSGAGRVHRLLAGRDDEVAAEHEVRAAGTEPHRLDVVRVLRDLEMAPDGAALLREPRHVEAGEALALEVGRHADDRADRHDARAADARHEDRVRLVERRLRGFGHGREQLLGVLAGRLVHRLAHAAAVDRHEARAEALHAREVLVARRLVDRALAAELGRERRDRHAVGLHAAVAAALADEVVDEGTLGRIRILASLPATPLFRRAGLVVNDDGHARDLAELALHGVVVVAVMHRHAGGEVHGGTVLLGLVGDDGDALRALGRHLLRDLRDAQLAVVLLAARHRDGVVEQDLVGHRRARRDCGAHGERTRVEVRAVADVLEDVLRLHERRHAHPARALAAHLRVAGRVAVHPLRHEVTTDAGHRAAAFRDARAAAVRTARTEVRRAVHRGLLGHAAVEGFLLDETGAELLVVDEFEQAPADGDGDVVRIERRVALEELHALLVHLADDGGRTGHAVERFLDLRLHQRALFLDDDDLREALRELADAVRLHGPRHAGLEDAQAETRGLGVVDAEVLQRLADVHVRLAARRDAELRAR